MLGRASIGNPWIFREIKRFISAGTLLAPPTLEERIRVCKTHLMNSIQWKGERLGIIEMRRHYSSYFRGLQNIGDYRMKLVTTFSLAEIEDTFEEMTRVYGMVA
jgi:tRNA-dihydrouridine synthase